MRWSPTCNRKRSSYLNRCTLRAVVMSSHIKKNTKKGKMLVFHLCRPARNLHQLESYINREKPTLASRERENTLLSAYWALHNQMVSLFSNALPGKLRDNFLYQNYDLHIVVHSRRLKRKVSKLQERLVPLTRTEQEGHAKQVIPLCIRKILWRQRSRRPLSLLVSFTFKKRCIKFSQLLTSL